MSKSQQDGIGGKYKGLSAYHRGGNQYMVVNTDTEKVYEVDMNSPPSCGCEDFTYDKNSGQACKHIQKVALVGPTQQSVENQVFQNLSNLVKEAEDAVEKIEDVRDSAQAARTADAQAAASDDSEDGFEPDDDGSVITDVEPDETAQQAIDNLSSWFNEAAGFNGFDGSIVELSYGSVEGATGVVVNTQPFSGDYYDTDANEWVDQEGFNEQKDTLVETVLSPRDEFTWYGEPDYQWFIQEHEISEVLE